MGKIGKFLTTAAMIATLGYTSNAAAQQIDQKDSDNFPMGVTECMEDRLDSKEKFYKEQYSLEFRVGMEAIPSIRRGNVLYVADNKGKENENLVPGTLVQSCVSVDLKWHYFHGLRAVNTYTKFKSDDSPSGKSATNIFLKFTPVYVEIMLGLANVTGEKKERERVFKFSTTKQAPFDFSYLEIKPVDRMTSSDRNTQEYKERAELYGYGEVSIGKCFDGTRIGGDYGDEPKVFGCLNYTRGEGDDYFVLGRVKSSSLSGSVNMNFNWVNSYLKLTKHKIDGPDENGFKDYEGTTLSFGVFVKI